MLDEAAGVTAERVARAEPDLLVAGEVASFTSGTGFILNVSNGAPEDDKLGKDKFLRIKELSHSLPCYEIYYLKRQVNRLYADDTAVTGNWQSKCSVYSNWIVIRCYKR
jgi:hypothetical protein